MNLFSGRYKALIVDGSRNGYLKAVCDYVHLNPARAGLLDAAQPLESYDWSSYPSYFREPCERPSWLRVDRLLGEWGIAKDSSAGREQFARCVETRRRCGAHADVDPYKIGWCVGSEEFRNELLARVGGAARPWHDDPEVRESFSPRPSAFWRRNCAAGVGRLSTWRRCAKAIHANWSSRNGSGARPR